MVSELSRNFTPLRYPGGKQKLSKLVSDILLANHLIGGNYIEPYAGGSGVAIELLLRGIVKTICLNDIDPSIYCFWYSVLNKTNALCEKILTTPLTIKEWEHQKSIFKKNNANRPLELGFSTLFLNRCNRSGILTAGVIGGIQQTGKWKIDARFNRASLVQRIKAIGSYANKISIHCLDAKDFIKNIIPKSPEKTFVYLDPPYYHKANKLYKNFYRCEDHASIAKLVQKNIERSWIVSYDFTPEISKLYSLRKQYIIDIQYSAAKASKGREILIAGKNVVIPNYLVKYDRKNSYCISPESGRLAAC